VYADINGQDSAGNTALHDAVASDASSAVSYLLSHGAEASMLNRRNMAAIHVAVDDDKVDALTVRTERLAVIIAPDSTYLQDELSSLSRALEDGPKIKPLPNYQNIVLNRIKGCK